MKYLGYGLLAAGLVGVWSQYSLMQNEASSSTTTGGNSLPLSAAVNYDPAILVGVPTNMQMVFDAALALAGVYFIYKG